MIYYTKSDSEDSERLVILYEELVYNSVVGMTQTTADGYVTFEDDFRAGLGFWADELAVWRQEA